MAQYSKDQLRSIFQNRFNQEAWKSIVVNIFGAGQVRRVYEKFTTDEDLEEGYFLGSIDTPDKYRIGLFYYKINNGSIAHKKVGFRNLLNKWVNPNWGEFEAAIVVFDDGKDWRLSFICDIKEEATAPKRFTYVFGEKDNFYKTPVDRFEELQKQQPTFENIRKTFSVDALSDDFFDDYRELYADFVEYITGKRYVKSGSKWEEKTITRPNHQFQTTFEGNDKLVRDYVKKMFGRIVFLYFLQRKGWLNGNKQYMHDLFSDSDKKDDFLDGVLEPLFFEVLNEEKPNRTKEAKSLPGCDNIPYLNGGLFARDEIDERTCVFPAEYFKRLFDFLDSYNFTIDENDTDDAEIGIDPEMLGRIFENLLEDNKDKGAFYTPKEIVDYMCRESLIAYLVGRLPEIKEEKLRLLVEKLDTTDLSDKDKLDIRKTLQKVKICDPAIGSGAFPMGLVNLLSKIYVAMKTDTDTAKMKRHIMEQNIYGVDIEQGAVDIARLRFWLAMIVEEKEPIPLPNLHFKIMQGNSLLESYSGIDLSDLTKVNAQKGLWDSENFERENLIEALRKYYKTADHTERDRLFNEIINNVRRQLLAKGITLPNGEDPSANTDFFLWHTWFSDVFANGGFDIVIGNPPYGASLTVELKSMFKNLYSDVHMRTPDTFNYFISQGIRLLKYDGVLSYIVPNTILSQNEYLKTRIFLTQNNKLFLVVNIGENVFEEADVPTTLLFVNKNVSPDYKIKYADYKNVENSNIDWGENLKEISLLELSLVPGYVIGVSSQKASILSKIRDKSITISDIAFEMAAGISTGCNKAFCITKEKIDERNIEPEVIRPLLIGRDIDRYSINWSDSYIIYTTKELNPSRIPNAIEYARPYKEKLDARRETKKNMIPWWALNWPRYEELFRGEKIIMRQTSDSIRAVVDENDFYPLNSILTLRLNYDCGLSYRYVLGILNSKVINFLYKEITQEDGRTFAEVKPINVRKLFIPSQSDNLKSSVEELVSKIVKEKKNNKDTSNLEELIDILLFKYYKFSYDEVLIIDPETPISREEYENFKLKEIE